MGREKRPPFRPAQDDLAPIDAEWTKSAYQASPVINDFGDSPPQASPPLPADEAGPIIIDIGDSPPRASPPPSPRLEPSEWVSSTCGDCGLGWRELLDKVGTYSQKRNAASSVQKHLNTVVRDIVGRHLCKERFDQNMKMSARGRMRQGERIAKEEKEASEEDEAKMGRLCDLTRAKGKERTLEEEAEEEAQEQTESTQESAEERV